MERPGTYRVEDDLSENWLERFAAKGLAEIEAYLGKHADFQTFLEDRD
jgi:hypothetical protein